MSRGGAGRHALSFGLVLLALVGAFVWGERAGWPWLARPMASALSQALGRQVILQGPGELASCRFGFWGGLRWQAGTLQIGAPEWSAAPYLVQAQGVVLRLRYRDLWRAAWGGSVVIEALQARRLDVRLERDAQQRVSWRFGSTPAPEAEASGGGPSLLDRLRFDALQVDEGHIAYDDAPLRVHTATSWQANWRSPTSAAVPGAVATPASASSAPSLAAHTTGSYGSWPVKAALTSTQLDTWLGGEQHRPWPLQLRVQVGRARVAFDGTVDLLAAEPDVLGVLRTSGPSLAAMGAPFGLTLPTTGTFDLVGRLRHRGPLSQLVVDRMDIGSSRLAGEFAFDRRGAVPLLAGRLGGARLDLKDLGPAIGAPAPTAEAASTPEAPRTRVLPDRPLDLPSLRAMNANVLIDLGRLELHAGRVDALTPLTGHLVLQGGVLTLSDLHARTAQGEVFGRVQLDGREPQAARWSADLSWRGVRLEDWVAALAPAGRAPYLSGWVDGRARLSGQGQSTAAWLASLDGQVQARLREGRLSHLVVEAAGLDVAEALGVWLKGDDDMPLICARASIEARHGVLTPRAFVLDTRDSTVWLLGQLSLRDERLGLELKVAPKDASVLTLRTPIQITGTLASPKVSVQAGRLWPRLLGAAALAWINPVAAILPLVDLGDRGAAGQTDQRCETTPLPLLSTAP